jgi:hypothetical protein
MKENKIEVYDNKNNIMLNYPSQFIFYYYYSKNNININRYSNYILQGIRISIINKKT